MRDHELERLGTLVDKIVSVSERHYQDWLTSAIQDIKSQTGSHEETTRDFRLLQEENVRDEDHGGMFF